MMIFVVMGVSGSGKTTIGQLLAKRAGVIFADADDYHPQANKDKMASGHPLNDADRQPWLETLNRVMQGWQAAGQGGALACSALKAGYRDTLRSGLSQIEFVLLNLPRAVLEARLAGRYHEFMTPALLDSQIATLEVPTNEADVMKVDNCGTPDEVVEQILSKMKTGA